MQCGRRSVGGGIRRICPARTRGDGDVHKTCVGYSSRGNRRADTAVRLYEGQGGIRHGRKFGHRAGDRKTIVPPRRHDHPGMPFGNAGDGCHSRHRTIVVLRHGIIKSSCQILSRESAANKEAALRTARSYLERVRARGRQSISRDGHAVARVDQQRGRHEEGAGGDGGRVRDDHGRQSPRTFSADQPLASQAQGDGGRDRISVAGDHGILLVASQRLPFHRCGR
mmetsp:Transcript_30426/g.73388  ORF Transcript_30426/g.73388 Transcript_30426/m.73388 type:complete len:225 (-) Transcript_30426:1750-2424(-)